MSFYLAPLMHNQIGTEKPNSVFNASDYDYQFKSLNYLQGDNRYTKKSDYDSKMTVVDASFNNVNSDITTIKGSIINISYDASNNRTNIQDVNAGTIYQADNKKIIQALVVRRVIITYKTQV